MIGSIAFDKMVEEDDVRTMMGVSPEQAAEFMVAHGCDVAALNCGTGIDMAMAARIVARYRAACGLPVMVQPNAGQPVLEDMKVVYKETPEEMAAGLPALLDVGPARSSAAAAAARPRTSAASARYSTRSSPRPPEVDAMRATITFDQAKAEATLQGDMPDGSGVGVNYVDVIAKASKLTLPDGRKLLLKRKGLKLTLAIGDKQGEALLRRLDHGPDVHAIVRKGIEAVALAAGARASFEPGALHLDID